MESRLQELVSRQKLAEWSERVAECRSSGKTVRDWCAEHSVSTASYFRWQRRLYEMAAAEQRQSAETAGHTEFAEIPVRRRNPPAAIVRLGDAEVEVFPGIDEETLRTVCRVLRHAE